MREEPQLKELDGVRAVFGVGVDDTRAIEAALPRSADVAFFRSAGWRFVEPSFAEHLALAGVRTARVFADLNRVVLFDGSLVIRFKQQVDPARIAEVLQSAGLEIVRRVPVAPNVFRVKPRALFESLRKSAGRVEAFSSSGIEKVSSKESGGLAVAKALEEVEDVMYTEPDFIEAIGSR